MTMFPPSQVLGSNLISLLRKGVLTPDDIYIVAPKVTPNPNSTGQSPLQVLENVLCENGVPVFISSSDYGGVNEDVIAGKVLFSTIHVSKGLERKLVVVFSFEKSYFTYFGKDSPPGVCPCTLYVAATRATDLLCVVAEKMPGDHLPFLRRLDLEGNPAVTVHRLPLTSLSAGA